MHSRLLRPAAILPLIVLLASSVACSVTRNREHPPAWSLDPAAGLDQRIVLAGVGSSLGEGADAAEAARRAAMAAVLEQLIAHVTAQTDSHQRESGFESIGADGVSSRVLVSDVRERIIRVTSEGELLGARFELQRAEGAEGTVTWARAVVDRNEMAEHTLGPVRQDLSRAHAMVESAHSEFALQGAPSQRVAEGIHDALAADLALAAPRAALPLLRAIRPGAGGRAAAETALIPILDKDVGTLLAQLAVRLDVQLVEEARVGFGGHPLPVHLAVRWDGLPLPGLLLAARFGSGPAASGRTDADGRVTLSVPAPLPGLLSDAGLRAGPDLDGGLGPVQVSLPIRFPSPADARIAIYSRHERVDAEGGPARIQRPSPLQPEIEALLGDMRFPVVNTATAQIGAAGVLTPEFVAGLAGEVEYVMQVNSRTVYSSTDGARGPLWYRSSVELRLTEVASGDTVTISVAERDTKAAGANPDQAAERSLARALETLSRPDEPNSLASMLRARFR